MNIPEKIKDRYSWFKLHSACEETPGTALEIISKDKEGLLSEITSKIHSFGGNLSFMQSWLEYDGKSHITLQIDNGKEQDSLIKSLEEIKEIESLKIIPTSRKTWGKRIIIIGGGAQVASVASGAIAEADRHNIRGETKNGRAHV